MLKVQLFGRGQAAYDGRPLEGFPDQQCHRLLCYLLLNRGRPHPRERLAAVFWSDYPTSTSRTYLRNCLWRLREALSEAGAPAEEYLRCQDGSLVFPTSGAYWLDVAAYEAATACCQELRGDQLAPQQAGDLEGATWLYTGDLLEGAYDDWCLVDRERLRLLHLQTLDKLLAYHEHAGTYEQGLACGQRILACDPTREKVHRQVMRLYWLLGDPVEALVQYRCLAQVLREELDTEPTPKTTALFEQMVRHEFDPARWPVHRQNGLPARLAEEATKRPAGEEALERLRRLEVVVEETAVELRDLRRLIETALGAGSQSP